jgi:diketogulonate reductase-like aldo/keto reductase
MGDAPHGDGGKEDLKMTTTTIPTLTLNNGLKIPSLGLGTLDRKSPKNVADAVEAAIADGYRLIDTAASYTTERYVGEGIRRSGINRSELFVTTKLWLSEYGYEKALKGFESSLRRLGLDYLDLYLLHWPVPADFETTIAAYKALEKLLAEGQVRAIGVSNFSVQHLKMLTEQSDVVPAVNQIELHPLFIQKELRDENANRGIVTESWSPIGNSVRVFSAPGESKDPLTHPTVAGLAKKYGKTRAQVILRWHTQHGLCAIPKSIHPERIAENINIFDFTMTPDELAAIDVMDTGKRSGPDPEAVNAKTFAFDVENQ